MASFFNLNEGPDPTHGYDVDHLPMKTSQGAFQDYDELVNSTLSGGSYIIPNTLGKGAALYNESMVGGERVYNLESMLQESKDASITDMIDLTNNGRVRDASRPVSDETPTGVQVAVGLLIAKDNQETAIKGIIESNPVNTVFLSDMNMTALQDGIKYGVYQRTAQRIGDQSPQELYIVMRSIMLQYANFQTNADTIVEEVRRLNTKVLIYCIENVSSNVLQKVQYLADIQTLPVPIERPSYVGKPGNYTYDISNLL